MINIYSRTGVPLQLPHSFYIKIDISSFLDGEMWYCGTDYNNIVMVFNFEG